MKRATFEWPVLYALVVTIVYVGDYAFYTVLTLAGANIYVANCAAFGAGSCTAVLLLRRVSRTPPRFPLFRDIGLTIASNGIVFLAGLGLFGILVEVVHMNHYWAKLLANVTTFLVNFLTRTHVFTES